MDGSDMAFDYKAVAAGIARSEGMGAVVDDFVLACR